MTERDHAALLAEIPSSAMAVSLSIVDTTTRFDRWSVEPFVEPHVAGHARFSPPSYAFKLVHPQQGTFLFDLGLRKDWRQKLPPPPRAAIQQYGWSFGVDKDVAQLLREQGEQVEQVRAIIWSHHHWDHSGDPSTFPPSTKLVVGPGFRRAFLPAYPDDPQAAVTSDAFAGRELEELDFAHAGGLSIAGFRALDYFGDGSLYLLDAPGHTVGHICGLARTTAGAAAADSTFVLMGGDIAHHVGQFRPSSRRPLPDSIVPDPRRPLQAAAPQPAGCPCAGYVRIHPERTRAVPFYRAVPGMAHNVEVARESIRKLEALDADPRVFVVLAHDDKLQGIVDLYPKEANAWKEKGWKELAFWRFLADFAPDGDNQP